MKFFNTPLKAKDTMTLANILCGFLSVIAVIEGHPLAASYLIFLGWFFDAWDGTVAKLLKQSNKFGAEFDNIADLVSYSMAPSFLVYGYLHDKIPIAAAAAVAAFPLAMGCIRFARFNVKRIEYPGSWIGYPRPASALLIIGTLNSHIVSVKFPFIPSLGAYIACAIVVAASMANLGLLPYVGHHNRKWPKHIGIFLVNLVVTAGVGFILEIIIWKYPFFPVPAGIFWDIVFVWLALYGFVHQGYAYSAEELAAIKKFTTEWLAEEKAELSGKH